MDGDGRGVPERSTGQVTGNTESPIERRFAKKRHESWGARFTDHVPSLILTEPNQTYYLKFQIRTSLSSFFMDLEIASKPRIK